MKISGITGPDRQSSKRSVSLLAAVAIYYFTAVACSKSNPFHIDVDINYCATIESFSVAPIAQTIGSSIILSAVLEDAEGDLVYPRWSSSPLGNTIDDSTAHNTRFNCIEEGRFTIYLEATDGICGDVDHIEVECFSPPDNRHDAGIDAGFGDHSGLNRDAGELDAGDGAWDGMEHVELP